MIVLLGLAGAGKSTQGQNLAEATGRVWLSVGEVLRATGQFDEILNAGKLVDDMTVVQLMVAKMAEVVNSGKQAILDGFPRDAVQAKWIAENLPGVIKEIVIFEVPKDELVKRLMERGRADDTEDAIRERFAISEENIKKICDILEPTGAKIGRIDGTGTREEVFERLKVATGGIE